jgi:hypothetical protein
MAALSPSPIIQSLPISGGLDGFRTSYDATFGHVDNPETFQNLVLVGDRGTVHVIPFEAPLYCVHSNPKLSIRPRVRTPSPSSLL